MADGSVVVIGAGVAGLACAQALRQAGVAVTVLDKGRGLGGRLATRRTPEGSYDHGASVMQGGGAFGAWLDRAVQAGAAAPWPAAGGVTGVPGMSGLVAPWAQGLDIRTSVEVRGLSHDGHWTITADGLDAPLSAARVVLAIPQPQAAALCAAVPELQSAVAQASMRPSWAAMVAFDRALPDTPDFAESANGPIARITRENSKPGRGGGSERFVIQAGADWSRAHLEIERPEAAELLLAAFFAHLGQAPVAPVALHGHRWRFGFTDQPLDKSYLYDAATGLGVCGDWCLGFDAAAAHDSGTSLARALL
jgi:renalase